MLIDGYRRGRAAQARTRYRTRGVLDLHGDTGVGAGAGSLTLTRVHGDRGGAATARPDGRATPVAARSGAPMRARCELGTLHRLLGGERIGRSMSVVELLRGPQKLALEIVSGARNHGRNWIPNRIDEAMNVGTSVNFVWSPFGSRHAVEVSSSRHRLPLLHERPDGGTSVTGKGRRRNSRNRSMPIKPLPNWPHDAAYPGSAQTPERTPERRDFADGPPPGLVPLSARADRLLGASKKGTNDQVATRDASSVASTSGHAATSSGVLSRLKEVPAQFMLRKPLPGR